VAPYAALADVKNELGALASGLTTTSVPNEDDVTNRILPDIQGEIDGILSSRGLVVPVTAPAEFLARLKSLNAMGAGARVAGALFPMAAGPQSTTFAEWLYGLYKDGLRRLENGTGIPADAIMTGAGALPRSFATSHPDSVSADVDGTPGNTIDPVFRRDTRW
jgi:hypothetical protein